jgi:hypothetical protein
MLGVDAHGLTILDACGDLYGHDSFVPEYYGAAAIGGRCLVHFRCPFLRRELVMGSGATDKVVSE